MRSSKRFDEDARGLCVSTNAGKSWSEITSQPHLVRRVCYVGLFVDPKNDQTVMY
jgi:hypothetical protein